ncbi:MAG: 5-formyltetrahydrofolate cyclo-ligase [Endomicrobium sp.]|jgi:5-formyltetrahydrofolate cyclo-ligase|nr:5-formyltetrahydrofolate cyclo-ligase [Endomicrobium sp.]
MNIAQQKNKLRNYFLYLRNNMPSYYYSIFSYQIVNAIKQFKKYQKSKIVMFYLSYGSEVMMDYMIEFACMQNKIVVLPVITNKITNTMEAVQILNIISDTTKAVYGIRQPNLTINNIIPKKNIDLIFVPGVAFDIYGYRIGYGKGYYDRWLQDVPQNKIVGISYNFQIIRKIPIDQYDLSVGTIITERQIIKVSRKVKE